MICKGPDQSHAYVNECIGVPTVDALVAELDTLGLCITQVKDAGNSLGSAGLKYMYI